MSWIKFIAILCAYIIFQCKPLACDDLKTDTGAADALKDLEKIISAVTEIALVAIRGLESSLKIIQQFAVKVAKDLIDTVGDDIFKKLDELKKDALSFGVDIIDCTEDREEDIKQLLVVFLNKTADCAIDRVNEVIESMADIVLDVQNANEELKNLTQRLDDCAKTDIECIEEVLKEIGNTALEIPDKVKEDIKKTQQKMDELVDYLFECEHDNYNQLQITSQEIFNGIVECVEHKMNITENEISRS
ncbi:hypothetical protein NQ318_013935 [Aromia moschata]|uniref:Uncharacterized protein n=1 Tax=Aromia moschata TaxID=1265417 RepID=A0AAV8Z9H0_9CUCU|nr:hypothetical protein NQ318_013935 [Aromia moschata]